jgi:hypothetical protein
MSSWARSSTILPPRQSIERHALRDDRLARHWDSGEAALMGAPDGVADRYGVTVGHHVVDCPDKVREGHAIRGDDGEIRVPASLLLPRRSA